MPSPTPALAELIPHLRAAWMEGGGFHGPFSRLLWVTSGADVADKSHLLEPMTGERREPSRGSLCGRQYASHPPCSPQLILVSFVTSSSILPFYRWVNRLREVG